MRWTLDFLNRQSKLAMDYDRVAKLFAMTRRSPHGISEQDFKNAGQAINLDPALLKAFFKVESKGAGFNSMGRLTVLYEPHRVHIETRGALTGMKFDWVYQGTELKVPLSYRGWRRRSNPPVKTPITWHPYFEDQAGQWGMINAAYEMHPDVLKGVSWGGFQILGKWGKNLGFDDTLHMINHMYHSELNHLDCALRYLRMAGGLAALKAGDFRKVATLYNGRGQVDYFANKFEVAYRSAQREFGTYGSAWT
jgi:hypothetical protein